MSIMGSVPGLDCPFDTEVSKPKVPLCKIIADACEEKGYTITRPPQCRQDQTWGHYVITAKREGSSAQIVLCQDPPNGWVTGCLTISLYKGVTRRSTDIVPAGQKLKEPVEQYVDKLLNALNALEQELCP